jgi:hypothetical protein
MTDLSQTIDPKSDQINADDLIAGPRTITVTRVVGNSDKDQPVSIFFEGDKGKPYKPCKSMRRVLVHLWGNDGGTYAGRSMTLVRDPKVKFGGIEVGGVRISHMSHIDTDTQLMLTSTRGKRDPYSVRRLASAPQNGATDEGIAMIRKIQAATSLAELEALAPAITDIRDRKGIPPTKFKDLRDRYAEKQAELKAKSAPVSDTNGDVDDYGDLPANG